MLESKVQASIKKKLKQRGWTVLKVIQLSENGYPDLLCLKHPAKVLWVEVKRPGEEPAPLQQHRHKQLREMGFEVMVLDNDRL